jgi:gliding motility-associated lipoprotein GldH
MVRKFLNRIIKQIIIAGILLSCSSVRPYEIYYSMKNHSWNRFNILRFEVPIKQDKKTFDIYFSVHFDRQYEYENLNFNMVMNTPDGEERINEYQMKIKSSAGTFLGQCQQDTCINTISLKKDILISKAGTLLIEIENLTPRLETMGVLGLGISLFPTEQ